MPRKASADYITKSKHPQGHPKAPRTFGTPGASLGGSTDKFSRDNITSGSMGEAMTARILDAFVAKHPGAAVYHSVRIPNARGEVANWDIDHVLLYPDEHGTPVVLVVDSKRWAAHRGEARYLLTYNPAVKKYVATDRGKRFSGSEINTASEAAALFDYLRRTVRVGRGRVTTRCALVIANDVAVERPRNAEHFSSDFPLLAHNIHEFERTLKSLDVGTPKDDTRFRGLHDALASCVSATDGTAPTPKRAPAAKPTTPWGRKKMRARRVGWGIAAAAVAVGVLALYVQALPVLIASGVVTLTAAVLVEGAGVSRTLSARFGLLLSLVTTFLLGIVVVAALIGLGGS